MNSIIPSPSKLFKEALYNLDIAREIYALYTFSNLTVTTRYKAGHNIFESDWDTLVILDALRTDALKEVADEYSFIDDIDQKTSVASTSKEWLLKTFTEQYKQDIKNTTYITGNGFVHWLRDDQPKYLDFSATSGTLIENNDWLERLLKQDVVSASTFERIEELWPLAEANPVGPAPSAEAVTEHSIAEHRRRSPEKMIVHYMQPHSPYLTKAEDRGYATDTELSPFAALIEERATKDEVWDLYIENVRYVLDNVEELLENIEAENVVITADHGELFGEWHMYGHAVAFPHPKLKRVPWVETTAKDEKTIKPNPERPSNVDTAVETHLEDLGYK